jgi:hypothetical protein
MWRRCHIAAPQHGKRNTLEGISLGANRLVLTITAHHLAAERKGMDVLDLMMRPLRYLSLAALAGLAGQVAVAFQETNTGAGPGAGLAAPPSTQEPFNKNGLNLDVTPPSAGKSGPEIRLPGLGTIGKLPKLDFGLELLYGATEPKTPLEDKFDPNNELQVRGRLTYPFPK